MRLELVDRDPRAQQRADPVDELRGGGLLAQLGLLAQPVELDQHLIEELGIEVGMMDGDDLAHQRHVGELDEVEDAAAQERVGQLLLVVRGDEHDGSVLGDDLLAGLEDREAHLVELAQQVVGKLEVCLVDLVDQQHVTLLGRERLAERPEPDVVADVRDVTGAEATVVEPLHGVVDVQAVGGLGRRLDVP